MSPGHHLELLAPARNAEIGRQAILHGADAVYIGGPAFGARHAADNPLGEIAELVTFAHRYGVRIYVTLNTILRDDELEPARRLAWDCWNVGVDALIVQDMGLLELDMPPIALHASTQCDIRTPEKAGFLAGVGFSQLVLARELDLGEIAAIAAAAPDGIVLEYFVHGALCVAYSGQCYISHAQTGRSANRGDCSQACRLPYSLKDERGRIVAFDKHLLSLKDNNQSANLSALVDAGVRSFKIEGRYKDASYVKNVTGHYRRLLDAILEGRPDLSAQSDGRTELTFVPDPDKTFHRGSTDYFCHGRQADIAAFDTPAFVGEPFAVVRRIDGNYLEIEAGQLPANGDGLTYLHHRKVFGFQVNRVEAVSTGIWRITPHVPLRELPGLQDGVALGRNRDRAWENALAGASATRRIPIDLCFYDDEGGFAIQLRDPNGTAITVRTAVELQPARNPQQAESRLRDHLARFGDSEFELRSILVSWRQPWFVPPSLVNGLRRQAAEELREARLRAHRRPARRQEHAPQVPYPQTSLSYLGNVCNDAARRFYSRHGVTTIEPAFEAGSETGEVPLMITKHCLRHSFSLCPRQAKGVDGVQGQVRADPMTLTEDGRSYRLEFDCRACEMLVMGALIDRTPGRR